MYACEFYLRFNFKTQDFCHEIEPIKAQIITQKCNAEKFQLLTELRE